MLLVISPAKTLDFDSPWQVTGTTKPQFMADSAQLIDALQRLSPHDISALMHISDKLGTLNFDRFQQWQPPFNKKNAKPALLAFKGDVYTGLAAETFAPQTLAFAQQHLRILSGLYGLLRPLDLMQAYRLEMGTKFENPRGRDLYQFWGEKITEALNKQAEKSGASALINLASNEYFRAVKVKQLQTQIITPVFKDCKNGVYKIISFYAKKARGLMAAYALENQLQDPQALKQFDVAGYAYCAAESTNSEWVFKRDEI